MLLHHVAHDLPTFSEAVSGRPLRPYQLRPARAILESVRRRDGLTFSVLMPRQSGKNETAAQVEGFLLHQNRFRGGWLVKAAPTFQPQLRTSIARLWRVLQGADWLRDFASREHGNVVRLGDARMAFYSAAPAANVVGATANHLLEIDEAQDVDEEQYLRVFRPMGATADVTVVLWGTALHADGLLERVRQRHLALEAEDGIQRNFEVTWEEVAESNPAYGAFVRRERERLGADHPAFRTQYLLQALDGDASAFLSATQRAYLAGDFPMQLHPVPGRQYVAGVDVAGEDEARGLPDALVRARSPRRDSTAVAIAEVDWTRVASGLVQEPRLRVVHLLWWTGRPHHALRDQLVFELRERWRCQRVVMDATGIGAGLASFLEQALGADRLDRFTFTAASKSRLGYGLLAAVNAGRLQVYRDETPERGEVFAEAEAARQALRSTSGNPQLSFFVPPDRGHDDLLVALALVVEAAGSAAVRRAEGRRRGR